MSTAIKSLKPKLTDKWSSAERIASRLLIDECQAGAYVRGTVETPQGFVLVYSQGLQYVGPTPLAAATADKPENTPLKTTTLVVIIGGRKKERVIDAAYSERRLVTLAREFAVEAAREAERRQEKENSRG